MASKNCFWIRNDEDTGYDTLCKDSIIMDCTVEEDGLGRCPSCHRTIIVITAHESCSECKSYPCSCDEQFESQREGSI